MTGRWGEIPFAAISLLFGSGIFLAQLAGRYLFMLFAAGTVALITAAILALQRDRRSMALSAALASILMGGVMLALAGRDAFPVRDLRALISHNALPMSEPTAFDGCVAEQTNRHGDESVTTIALRAYQKNGAWTPCRGGMILRIPNGPADEGLLSASELRIGDRIRGWAAWHIPRNYRNPGSPDHAGLLMRRGVSLIGRTKSTRLLEIIPGDCADFWTGITAGIRKGLLDSLENLKNAGHPEQAAILASLVIGDYSGLNDTTREAFQNSGTYHVLVVSGLHVAWIAGVLLHGFRRMRIPQDVSHILVACLLFLYAGIVGFQASISRALWMFILYLTGQACFRRAAPANIALASAFSLLAARPEWLFDAGFQLSFLSVLAICLMGLPMIELHLKPLTDPLRNAGCADRLGFHAGRLQRAGRRLRTRCELLAEACADRWHSRLGPITLALGRTAAGAALRIGSMIVITLSVQIWLEPLLAYHFNRLSWIAPLANLVAVPLSSVVLAAGMIAALASGVPILAAPLLQFAGSLSRLLLLAAQGVSALPGAWQRCPTPPPQFVLAGIALLFAWWFAAWQRRWIPWCYAGVLLLCLAAGTPKLRNQAQILHREFDKPRILTMTFLDVGEGDSMVIRFPDGRIWIVDGGGIHQTQSNQESEKGFDIGEAVVSRYLWFQWITRLDWAILTHPDLDHAGGMPALLDNFRIGKLGYGESGNDPILARILKRARERGTELQKVQAGQMLERGNVRVLVFNPAGDGTPRSTNENSVVLQVRYGRFSALLTGDLEKTGEREFLSRLGDARSLLLKVAHHGSRSATTEPFLARVQPHWAVISSGRNNPFGHPARDVVFRLLRCGSRLLLTQDQGAITFETDGERYLVRSHVCGVLETGLLP